MAVQCIRQTVLNINRYLDVFFFIIIQNKESIKFKNGKKQITYATINGNIISPDAAKMIMIDVSVASIIIIIILMRKKKLEYYRN